MFLSHYELGFYSLKLRLLLTDNTIISFGIYQMSIILKPSVASLPRLLK